MELTFDKLPQAVSELTATVDRIEKLLQLQTAAPPQKDLDEIIGIDAACVLLGLKKPTIYGLICQGKLPYMKKGKKLYFSRHDLTDWINQGRKTVKNQLSATVDNAIISAKRKGR